ncbi:MAG TPA: TlpA disulfide reductase family protein [Acidimicrobiales bacterium]|jgi:cytochrome c biogenesis protein CcmG/thiol:disulfide interchange protein DsbE|nr:TlpA disulfide reductase family protein [Acidimicrobiales bacterium]
MSQPPESIPLQEEPTATNTTAPTPTRSWRTPGRRRRIASAGILVVVVIASIAIWQAESSSSPSSSNPLVGRTGQPAPAVSLPSLSDLGQRVSLAAFLGKPLVVNFWASWCIPCRTEMPLLEQAFQAEHGKVQFLGIDANDTQGAGRAFLDQVHVTYPAAFDANGAVATQFSLFGLPTTLFISPSGTIVGRYIGQLHPDTLQAALEEAFHA